MYQELNFSVNNIGLKEQAVILRCKPSQPQN